MILLPSLLLSAVLLKRASFHGGDVILKWHARLSLNLLEEKEVSQNEWMRPRI
jgi:hypothetical protein